MEAEIGQIPRGRSAYDGMFAHDGYNPDDVYFQATYAHEAGHAVAGHVLGRVTKVEYSGRTVTYSSCAPATSQQSAIKRGSDMTMTEINDDKVVPIKRGRMTTTEYVRERARIRTLYGDGSKEAAAKASQALAKLFAWSGWNETDLAAEERGEPTLRGLDISAAVGWYTSHYGYLKFLMTGARRIDLEGEMTGTVTAPEAQKAVTEIIRINDEKAARGEFNPHDITAYAPPVREKAVKSIPPSVAPLTDSEMLHRVSLKIARLRPSDRG